VIGICRVLLLALVITGQMSATRSVREFKMHSLGLNANNVQPECGPMPNVMAAQPHIGGASVKVP